MVAMTARHVAQKLANIQSLSRMYHQAVNELRSEAIKTTVKNLRSRHKAYLRRGGEIRSFVGWLARMEHMEATFWHTTTGAGMATRRRWAIGYHSFLVRKELTLADDPQNLWLFDALRDALNAWNDDPDWLIDVEVAQRKGIERYGLKPGASFVFARVERPMEPEGDEVTTT